MSSASEELKDAHERRFLLGRVCRILMRIEPLLNRHNVDVRVRDRGMDFRCLTEEAVMDIGAALHIKVELHWVGVYASKQATAEADGLIYEFQVYMTRPIRYDDCIVKRATRRNQSGWRWAKLMFLGDDHLILAEHSYPAHNMKKDALKKLLWDMAKRTKSDGAKFRTYAFIDPF